ncbi:MAG: hypothetical protein EBZ77_05800 [Chitinophagia bacterium]|nr:hypothetical protein [Chitinophagia bacterium]
MRRLSIKTIFFLAATMLFVARAGAEEVAAAGKPAVANLSLYSLIGVMVVLLFLAGVLSYTVRQLAIVVKDKNAKERQEKNRQAAVVPMLLLAMLLPGTLQAADTSKAYQWPTSVSGIPFTDFLLLTVVIVIELAAIFFLMGSIKSLLKALKGIPEVDHSTEAAKSNSWFWVKFNGAKAIEQEHEILLDHNYDGIQELDNSLPPWWLYGFYCTILFACIYIYRYHIDHSGMSQEQEYATEMEQGEADKAAYLASSNNNIDENNVVLLTHAAGIGAGKEVFSKNCIACHIADGGGGVGPNLTDDYWLHGGGLKDIFKSIKYGWQDKGMKSWKDDLSPLQIQQVASFIKSLRGTHPAAPKAPQGDLYVEAGKPDSAGASAPVADSTKKTDTAAHK